MYFKDLFSIIAKYEIEVRSSLVYQPPVKAYNEPVTVKFTA